MNCPSRTDDEVLLNPTWNQNPPRFAADLTTCQDLNGIANARELGDADRLCSGANGLRDRDADERQFQEKEKQRVALGKGVEGPEKGAVVLFESFWTEDYQAAPGAIMLASIFFVTIIEMIFSPGRHCCGGNEGVKGVARDIVQEKDNEVRTTPNLQAQMRRTYSDGSMQDHVRQMGNLRGRVTSISRTLSQYRAENQRLDAIESAGDETPAEEDRKNGNESAIEDPERNHKAFEMTPEQAHKKAVLQCFLLEMGILFHSIFIGMSLAVAIGNDFVVLLIAIIFHQTFEGLALGVRIAAISWPARSPQPWLMAVAYGFTTPLGQAIGIATHTLYSPDSEVGLLVVGIMNAISAGFLVFASLVELMSEDFLSDESWQVLRGKKRVAACLLVFFGAFLMSLVGAWA
ncbi:hypothetical protein SLS59_000249 [Nothophoma quercina]|uniref:Zip-domain-containing protein n=1 Tax=Nothophoma quercina TaxID=749835 RepID=A0ABR3S4C8_9PLEO